MKHLQSEDGTPHMTYYDPDRQLSFVWDGLHPCIQVCHGGYGEPVRWEIPLSSVTGTGSAQQILAVFRDACVSWTNKMEELFR